MTMISRAILSVVLFVAIVSGGYAIHQQRDMAHRFDRLQDEETGRQMALADEAVRRQVGQLRVMASILAMRDDVRLSLQRGVDAPLGKEFSSQLGALAVGTGVGFVRLFDANGRRVHESLLGGKDITAGHDDPLFAFSHRTSLQSGRPQTRFICTDDCHALVWVPVQRGGRPVGTIMVAAPLTDILLSFYRIAGTEVGLARRDASAPESLVAMTGGEPSRQLLAGLSGGWRHSPVTGGEWQQAVADGRNYRVSRWATVFESSRLPVDFVTITDVEATRQDLYRVLRANVAAAIGWMLLAAAVIWLLSRRLIVRLRRIGDAIQGLAADTRADTRGTLAAELDAHTEDEFGKLAVIVADVAGRLENAEAERERIQLQLQQAHKMEAIGQLAGGIAHDFNNILASIMGYTVLARDRFAQEGDGRLARYLGEILQASTRARDLVAQLLTFSRQDVGKRQRIQIEPLLKELTRMLAPLLSASLKLRLDIQPVPPVLSNPMQVQQIVMNLAINARDATHGRGEVTVSLRYPVDVTAAVCASCHGGISGEFVELAVSDNGPGIAPEHMARIFDPFFTTKEQGKGTGMGLSIVHGMAHEAGGHLRVDTVAGGGTVFRVLLPVAPDREELAELGP